MVKSVNDNEPTQAWLDFYADKELYDKCVALDSILTARLKTIGSCFIDREAAERSVSNFIWFMKFEISCRETEIKERRNQMVAVNG